MIFEELKQCPFCGGNAVLLHGKPNQLEKGTTQAFVQCSTCKAKTKTFINRGGQSYIDSHIEVDKLAMDAWNKRW